MLGVAVFIASFATMAFELAGARSLAPYLGTTIEVWSGTIATVLGGLALGYWIGGIVADRFPKKKVLAGCLFLAGVAIAIATILHDIVPRLIAYNGIPLSLAAILVGLILFVPAAAFLGAASPAAAKLALTSLSGSARTVGRLSALATLGSITGTVATTTVIIPYVGTSALLASTALLLVFTSFLVERQWMWGVRIAVAAGIIALAWTGTAWGLPGAIATIDTAYSRIRVIESYDAEGKTRHIATDPYGTQCGALINEDGSISTKPIYEYTQFFDIGKMLVPDAKRALVIGGCNLSYPRHLLNELPEGRVDVLEIDPGMTQIARDYFDFKDDPRLTIYHGDARSYLNTADTTYDLIYGDAFNAAGSIPAQLATREAMERIASLLAPGGVYVMNTFGALEGEVANFSRAEVATLRAVFPHVRIYTIVDVIPSSTQNLMIIASQSPIPTHAANDRLQAFLSREVPFGTFGSGLVLTDDYAPVESLTAPLRARIVKGAR